MTYRADIDGLRAIAVLAVLLFHCAVPGVSGGYVGVDVFFVISGYVITRTLMRDIDRGQLSIRAFYERRIRRIFPALIATSAVTWAVAWLLLLPSDFLDFSRSLVASALSLSNVYFWKYSGYFETSAALRPLLHTWSLSVEEQFYLLAPAALFICYRYFNARYRLLLVPVALCSLALSIYATNTAPTANFFLLPTRAWELLIGVLLAIGPTPRLKPLTREIAASAGLILIAYAISQFTPHTPFPGVTALIPCIGAALIILAGANSEGTTVGRFLSLPPLVGIGLISYSLYLVHWPLLVFTRYTSLAPLEPHQSIIIICASFVLATLSWKFIEQPFRKKRTATVRRSIFPPAFAALGATLAAGVLGVITHGVPARFPDLVENANASQEPVQNTWKTGTCFLMDDYDLSRWDLKSCTRTSHGTRKILLWGDSFAAHYTPGLEQESNAIDGQVIQYTAAGCPPILSYYSYARPNCTRFNRNALNLIRSDDIKTVVLSSRWVDLQQRGLDSIQSTIEQLKAMGVDVWVIGQSPEFAANVDLIDYRNRHSGNAADAWPMDVSPDINVRLRRAAKGAHFIDPLLELCSNRSCPYRDQTTLYYADYGHFSDVGSARAVRAYFPFVKRKAGSPSPEIDRNLSQRSASRDQPSPPSSASLETGTSDKLP